MKDIVLEETESPRRPDWFVTQKIARGMAEITNGRKEKLRLGNIDACRDWGFAGDYARAIWMMLQTDVPDDYIVANGQLHSIRDSSGRPFPTSASIGKSGWNSIRP